MSNNCYLRVFLSLHTRQNSKSVLWDSCVWIFICSFACFRYAKSSGAFSSGIFNGHLFFGQWSDENSTYGLVSLGTLPLRHWLSERPWQLHQVQRPRLSLHSRPLIHTFISFLSSAVRSYSWIWLTGCLRTAGKSWVTSTSTSMTAGPQCREMHRVDFRLTPRGCDVIWPCVSSEWDAFIAHLMILCDPQVSGRHR